MFNQMFGLIGRKLSAHLLTTCIFFILILVVLIGGAIQVISSLAFSAYVENSPRESSSSTRNSAVSSTSEPLSLMLDGETDTVFGAALRFNKSASNGYVNPSKSQNGIYASMKNDRDKSNAARNSFSNTKILYKAYNGLSGGVDVMDKSSASSSSSATASSSSSSSSANGKSRTINSTVYKSVTPSITDRVIADLKKEEYLNQQRSKLGIDGDGIEVGENDEAIYIDGDDEEEANTPSSTITEIETSIEKLPDDSMSELKSNSATADNAKQKKVPQTIVGFVDISDTDSSEAVDIDDEDYDDYFNSGSGDFSITDWVATTIEKIKAKKLNKQERILKSFADNSYGMGDSSQEMDVEDDQNSYSGYNSGDEHHGQKYDLTPEKWEERDKLFVKTMNDRGFVIEQIVEDGK
ncbi:uncharacterized protein LOC129572505 [Sitodiplosis mosellana]|uniref:uncharacterized protein LOC129572505 n=1 Tax=Sitodiplosis mosellana TaxID=263140 RepID=UPI0024439FB5|nr:uncharacterized protein LOC129572505 [Sitodiplosis mosellana]